MIYFVVSGTNDDRRILGECKTKERAEEVADNFRRSMREVVTVEEEYQHMHADKYTPTEKRENKRGKRDWRGLRLECLRAIYKLTKERLRPPSWRALAAEMSLSSKNPRFSQEMLEVLKEEGLLADVEKEGSHSSLRLHGLKIEFEEGEAGERLRKALKGDGA